jgi:hypothetical protein
MSELPKIPLPDHIPVGHITSYKYGYVDGGRAMTELTARMTPTERVGTMPWIVVQKRETDPAKVWAFPTETEARAFYDQVGTQWTETFLCKVVVGPLT